MVESASAELMQPEQSSQDCSAASAQDSRCPPLHAFIATVEKTTHQLEELNTLTKRLSIQELWRMEAKHSTNFFYEKLGFFFKSQVDNADSCCRRCKRSQKHTCIDERLAIRVTETGHPSHTTYEYINA